MKLSREAPRQLVGTLLYSPVRQLMLSFLMLSLLCLGAVLWLDSRTVRHLDAIRSGVARLHEVQSVGLELTRLQVAATQGNAPAAADVERLRLALLHLVDEASSPLDASSARAFRAASEVLGDATQLPALRVALAQRDFRDATYAEVGASASRLEAALSDSYAMTVGTMLAIGVLPIAGVLSFVILRRRVSGGLRQLHDVLLRLAEGRFEPVRDPAAEPLLRELLENYNRAVCRLEELEREHATRALTLEQEVRAVTQRLMEQQSLLAQGERMAAVGELAASVAHELRNPLAGIQFAVANIRDSLDDPDLRGRSEAVLAEIHRMGRLLEALLAPARPRGEVLSHVDLRQLLEDFSGLAIYQAPPGIELRTEAPDGLLLEVPAAGLRQALLNLVLNAFEAMAGRTGEVVVRAGLVEGRLRISVLDRGPGFPPSLLASGVQQLRSGREGGIGLGLAIVQRFAREFGGELQLAQAQPRGAEVTLTLPAKVLTPVSGVPR